MVCNGIIGLDIKAENFNNILDNDEVIINSPGGSLYEGWRIYDTIKLSQKQITTGVIGICASAAIQVLLAGNQRWASENSRLLIHKTSDIAIGNAEDIKTTADEMIIEDNVLAQKYAMISGRPIDEVMARMKEERIMMPEEALQWNIINEIKNTSNIMELKEIHEKMSMLDKAILGINNFLFGAKNIIIQDVNGTELDFGEAIKTVEEIKPGVKANVNGTPASGEYVLASGETYVFDAGTLSEIKQPEQPVEVEVEALKTEVVNLNETILGKDSEIQNLKNELLTVRCEYDSFKNDTKNQVDSLVKDYTNFKNQFNPETPIRNTPETKQEIIVDRVKKNLRNN
jgi:ATP-dependent Clp protease protease subunit